MSPRTKLTPEIRERMRQFQEVAKVAIQLGQYCPGGVGRQKHRIALNALGRENFGLTHNQSRFCIVQAQKMLSDVSDSVSSETLVIAQRRRSIKVLQPAA